MVYLFLLVHLALAQVQIPLTQLDSEDFDYNFDKTLYTSTISIGTPPQNFTLLFDTASAFTWVLALNSTVSHPVKSRFIPETSSTFVDVEG